MVKVANTSSVLQGIDLNHLRALHVLLDEASVGRAATRLSITPPAASNALRRLREMFDDQLLVRSGRSMVRTALAQSLRGPAEDFIRTAERLLQQGPPFAADTWRGTFALMTSDYVYLTLAGRLERALEERVPGLDLEIAPVTGDSTAWLREHDGLAIGPFGVPNTDVQAESLFHDQMVLVVRAGHRLTEEKPTLARYCAEKHVLVAPRGQPGSRVDTMLREMGRSRRVTRIVPTHTLAAQIVATSDCVSTLPARFVAGVGRRFGLVARPLPLRSPKFEFSVSWHRRHSASPVHAFVRGLLREAVAKASARGAGSGGSRPHAASSR